MKIQWDRSPSPFWDFSGKSNRREKADGAVCLWECLGAVGLGCGGPWWVSAVSPPRRGGGDIGAQPSPGPAEALSKRPHLPPAQPLAAGTARWPLFVLLLGRYRRVHPLLQLVLLATGGFGRNDLSFLTDFIFFKENNSIMKMQNFFGSFGNRYRKGFFLWHWD